MPTESSTCPPTLTFSFGGSQTSEVGQGVGGDGAWPPAGKAHLTPVSLLKCGQGVGLLERVVRTGAVLLSARRSLTNARSSRPGEPS